MSFSKSPLSNVALVLIAGLGAASPLRSQQSPDQQAPPPPQASSDQQQQPPPSQSASPAQQQVFTQDQLNQLLGPIALYPDALIAIILPASTVPSDIVLAHRYLKQNGDPNQVSEQPWDNSVKSLVRYPDVLNWMDQNLQWTTTLGQAFMAQPADVMNAVQALRAQAKANGNLASNSQQQVVQAQSSIVIQPTQPDTIYVPQYDPNEVYSQSYSDDSGPPETFGVGFSTGPWLNYGCSWGGDPGVYYGNWNGGGWNGNGWNNGGGGYYGGGYGGTFVNISNPNRWRPSQSAWHQHQQFYRNHYSSSSSSTHVSAHHTSVHVTTPTRFHVSGASASHTSVSHTNVQTKGGTEVNSTSVHHHNVSSDALHPTTAPHVNGESAGKIESESHATASHSSGEAEHTHSHTSATSENSSGQTVHHHHTSSSTEAAAGASHTHSEASSETVHHHTSSSGGSEVHHSSESSGVHHSSGSSSSEVHHSSQSAEVHHSSAPAEQHHSAPQHASSGGQSHQSSGHSGGGGSDKDKDKKN